MTKLATVLAAALVLVVPARAEDSPVAVVQGAADLLASALETRRNELESDREALYTLIDGILESRFDRRYAAQLVLGRHWREASDAQRADFIEAFYGLMLRRYADGVLQYNEDRMRVLPYRGDDSERRTVVKTEVTLDDGTDVPVNYALVRRSNGWKVYDVTIEGISYVRNFRTEMNAEISAKGLDAVIERLRSEEPDGEAQAATE